MLVFWDKRQININNWLGDEIKKLRNVKYLSFVITTDEQKELYRQYKDLLEENKNTRDKYIRWLNKIKAENILQGIIEPILQKKAKYFEDYYDSTLRVKRNEYIQKMRKKLKTEREIISPF